MDLIIFWVLMFFEYFEEAKEYIGIILVIIVLAFIWVKFIHPHVKKYIKKKNFTFNEYEDLDKIEQNYSENEQLKNELQLTQKNFFINSEDENNAKENVSISRILGDDNNFDAELFKKWSKNIFLYLQLGDEKDLELIKHSVEENLLNRKLQLLKDFNRDNIELRREDLLIEELKIYDYSKWLDKAEIKVYIKAKLREYIINKNTQKVLKGTRKKLSERNYILTFEKQDSIEQVGFISNCPNCGAAIADTEFGKCQYCGSLINPIRYNWKLIKYVVL